MQLEGVRKHCLSFPSATETVQWGSDLVFKIGGKMFAVCTTEPAPVFMSFKCSPEDFAELTERPGIIPAPYLARAQWVALETEDALPAAETKRLLRLAYDIVLAKLPKSQQAKLGGGALAKTNAKAKAR
jgi:predicted DNA-binding protein (MmcQ/YjbR family)